MAVVGAGGWRDREAGDGRCVEAQWGVEEGGSSGSREEFYLVAPRDGRARQGGAPEHDDEETDRSGRAPIALGLTGTMVLAAATGLAPIVTAAFLAALLMILAGCLRPA